MNTSYHISVLILLYLYKSFTCKLKLYNHHNCYFYFYLRWFSSKVYRTTRTRHVSCIHIGLWDDLDYNGSWIREKPYSVTSDKAFIWIYVKCHCSKPIYFSFRRKESHFIGLYEDIRVRWSEISFQTYLWRYCATLNRSVNYCTVQFAFLWKENNKVKT